MARAPRGPGPADEELVAQAREGDAGAFRVLVERYQRRAYGIACGVVGDREDALEVVQEAFLKAFRMLGAFRGESSFYTWFYRILMNVAIDLHRKVRPAPVEGLERLGDARAEDPAAELHRTELRAAITSAIEALPPEQQAVVILREIEGLSYAEIAEVEQVPVGTVMSRLFYARRKLQAALGQYRGT